MPIVTGDPHNFGRRVHRRSDQYLEKPRPIGWEWLFLSRTSPLRNSLSAALKDEAGIELCRVFRELEFVPNTNKMLDGAVEILKFKNELHPSILKDEYWESVGAFIGIATWFGLGDLHSDNVAIGTCTDGEPVCMPLDLECIFNRYQLPSQTLLISSKGRSISNSGLAALHPIIACSDDPVGIVSKILYGYTRTLAVLNLKEQDFSSILQNIPGIGDWPIRVIIRETADYKRIHGGGAAHIPELLLTERIQLERDDVPYFFGYLGNNSIYYYTDARSTVAPALDVLENQSLFPVLSLCMPTFPKGHISRKGDDLQNSGLLQVARAFLPQTTDVVGARKWKDVRIDYSFEEVQFTDNGQNPRCIQCKR